MTALTKCLHSAPRQVAPEYLASHVDRLLKALLVCFFDESWPVRDAACVASGRFAGAYPEQCRPSLDKLYERCVPHVCNMERGTGGRRVYVPCGAFGFRGD